jgi:hypothetical protein
MADRVAPLGGHTPERQAARFGLVEYIVRATLVRATLAAHTARGERRIAW